MGESRVFFSTSSHSVGERITLESWTVVNEFFPQKKNALTIIYYIKLEIFKTRHLLQINRGGKCWNHHLAKLWQQSCYRWWVQMYQLIWIASVDGRNPTNQLRLVVYPLWIWYIVGGFLVGFLPATAHDSEDSLSEGRLGLVVPRWLAKVSRKKTQIHQKLNGTLPIRYSGLFGVRSVGPVGDFLEQINV